MKKQLKLLLLFVILPPFLNNIAAQIVSPLPISKESEIDSKTYTGMISEHYANGSPSLLKKIINGQAEGLWLEWYPNGNLRFRAFWKNDKGHGKWEYFYENGALRSESFYMNDIAQGFYKEYHQNGQIKNETTYIDGNKDGIELIYDPSGMLIERKRFENGIQIIDEPLIFEKGIISSENGNEWGITFMPDGNTAYFTRRDLTTGLKRIYRTKKTKNGWSFPEIAPFSTDEDEAAFINQTGTKLYFASYRSLPNTKNVQPMDMNIWVSTRKNDEWSTPKPLSSSINKTMEKGNVWPNNYEAGPTTDVNGNLYFWTKSSSKNSTNIYFSERKEDQFLKPIELIPPSDANNFDTSPCLSPDGTILFFASDDRYDGFGGSDIYYSVKNEDGWSAPKNLGPVVNSSQSDGFPSFSPDGKYFYFSSNRGDLRDKDGERISNIYFMETRFLLIEK